jgi:TPR repeat protein
VALSACLALLCMACSKKQPQSENAASEKQSQQTKPGQTSSVPTDMKDGPQVAATQPATHKAKVTLPISDPAKVRSAAEQGSTRAQRLLGVMYSSGQGVPQDYSVAAQWFQKAAEGGDRVAYVDLGVLYRQGLGVPKDPVAAYTWFSLAAEKGDDYSKTALPPLASAMSAQQLSDAQERAADWTRRHPN